MGKDSILGHPTGQHPDPGQATVPVAAGGPAGRGTAGDRVHRCPPARRAQFHPAGAETSTLGDSYGVHPKARQVQELHDAMTRAGEALPLA